MTSTRHALVVGNGGWGTALALVLQSNGVETTVWGHNPDVTSDIATQGENTTYLPGIALPDALTWTSEATIPPETGLIVLAAPSRFFRSVLREFQPPPTGEAAPILLSVSKGLDPDTSDRLSDVARAEWNIPCGVLSGPSHAEEVGLGAPSALTVAHPDPGAADVAQQYFSTPTFRVYTSPDVVGVELGGVLKNVMAIAAGVADGIGFGDNTKAALITRGLAEMRRLGVALGADGETFSGLSGLGDLIVTCTSRHSRNRGFGETLGSDPDGPPIPERIAAMDKVVEGYWNASTAQALARKHGLEVPIIDEVCAILRDGKEPRQAVIDLMTRKTRPEAD